MTTETPAPGSSESESVEQKLNRETAKIGWNELARLFATGVVIVVQDGLDLVGIAKSFVEDDSKRISILMERNQVWKATDDDAVKWNTENAEVWAVVVSPWVLVQGSREYG